MRPERLELPTPDFVGQYSIQLSYGRIVFGRGDEIRTHDTDFKDQCLRPLGDTPTIKQDSIFWLFFKKRFLMFAVAILKLVVMTGFEPVTLSV